MSVHCVPGMWTPLRNARLIGQEMINAHPDWRPLKDGFAQTQDEDGPDPDALRTGLSTPAECWEQDGTPLGRPWTILYFEETLFAGVTELIGSYEVRFLDVPNGDGPVLCVMKRFRRKVVGGDASPVSTMRVGKMETRGRPRKETNSSKEVVRITTEVPHNPELDEGHRMTRRLVRYIERQAHRRTFAEVARETGASETVVATIFYDYAARVDKVFPRRLPKFLGIDNKVLGGRHYTQLTDLEAGKVIELIEGTSAPPVNVALARWEGRDQEMVVTMDYANAYAASVKDMLHKALSINDKRHIINAIRDRLNSHRSEIEKNARARGEDISHLAHSFRLLNKRRHQLSETERARQEVIFERYPDLRLLYIAKEEWFGIFQAKDQGIDKAGKAVRSWLWRWVEGGEAPEITRRIYGKNKKTIDDRFCDIIAYFSLEAKISDDRRATNAATEALNGEMDRLYARCRGFGHKDDMFYRLRLRVLHWCGERTWESCQVHLAGHHLASVSVSDDTAPPLHPNVLIAELLSLRIGDSLGNDLIEALKKEYEQIHGVSLPFL